MATSSPPGSRDRLSELQDGLLGDILSFLPNKEAARAAALSRRWRHVFCNVDTVSFGEPEGERATDWTTTYYEAKEKKSCSGLLLDDVWSALLCRRRCAGAHMPLRRLRVAFDRCHGWDWCHVDQWLSYVLRHSSMELHLDMAFRLGRICEHSSPGGHVREWRGRDGWYDLPTNLFSCKTMRSLCLSYCGLNLPAAIVLPFLETLRLTGVQENSESSIARLLASCPRLVDLTLEANDIGTVSVLDRRLRRFALRCCHDIKSVDINASELSSLDYRGTVPEESLLSLHGLPEVIPSCIIDFCKVLEGDTENGRIRAFLEKMSGAKRLHLHHRCLPARSFEGFPTFHNLTRLVLQGPLQSPDVVRVILEQTPNLEILSFFMESSVVPEDLIVPDDKSSFAVPCLRNRVREINMVHYAGDELQRTMAWLLFANALVLKRICVMLVKGSFEWQDALQSEIRSWVVAADVEKIIL